jgi:hypothetical protein
MWPAVSTADFVAGVVKPPERHAGADGMHLVGTFPHALSFFGVFELALVLGDHGVYASVTRGIGSGTVTRLPHMSCTLGTASACSQQSFAELAAVKSGFRV